jgi:hypothetical protein
MRAKLLPFVPVTSHVLQEAIYIANYVDWQDKYLVGMQDHDHAPDKNNFYFYFFCCRSFKVTLYPYNRVIISKDTTKREEVSHQFFS